MYLGPLAQSVEQRTFNPWVVGSIPTGPTLDFASTSQLSVIALINFTNDNLINKTRKSKFSK
jgi:hypothetical protein